MFVSSGKELIEICNGKNISIYEYSIQEETEKSESSRKAVVDKMRSTLHVMMNSSQYARENPVRSVSGLIGGDAYKIEQYADRGETLTGDFMNRAMARALSSSEVNAAMGRIVACPTAAPAEFCPQRFCLPEKSLTRRRSN